MAIRNWDKERGISWASRYRQFFNRNRTKRIKKGSIPTVKFIFASQIYIQLTCVLSFWSCSLLSYEKYALPFEACSCFLRESELFSCHLHGEHRHTCSLTNSTYTMPSRAVFSSKNGEGRQIKLVVLPLRRLLTVTAGVMNGHIQMIHLRVAIKHLSLGVCIYQVRC